MITHRIAHFCQLLSRPSIVNEPAVYDMPHRYLVPTFDDAHRVKEILAVFKL